MTEVSLDEADLKLGPRLLMDNPFTYEAVTAIQPAQPARETLHAVLQPT